MSWRIGCSGFSYKDWAGFFYPDDLPQSQWLAFYAGYFDTLELNVTFYRLPKLSFFQNLYLKTPGDFSFVIKAPGEITHLKKFKDIQDSLIDFYSLIKKGLKGKLRAVLFQFPPSFSYSPESLNLICSSLDRSFINVVEFRHTTWWNEEVYKQLGSQNISFCSCSYPGLPDEVILNTKNPYYRFHGVPKLYYSMYTPLFLEKIANAFMQNKKLEDGYLLFNNTATRAALENASFVQEYVDL